MTKQEFVDRVHASAGTDQSKACTTAIVDAVFDNIAEVVHAEQQFRWNGFGTFETRERAARDGRNPQTGEPMQIKASTTVAFRPASALKARLEPKTKTKGKAKK